MDRMTVATVVCMVDRGKEKIRVEVPKHEVEVLRAVHGRMEVQVIDSDYDEMELEASAEAEWDRLNRTYKRIGGGDVVKSVWPDGPIALERLGFRSDTAPVDRDTDLRVINHKRKGHPKKPAEAAA